MLRYAITDRRMFAGDERDRRSALLAQAARLAADGVDFLQLREKDLPSEELLALAQAVSARLRDAPAPPPGRSRTILLLNLGGLAPPPDGHPRGETPALSALLASSGAGGWHLPERWSPEHIAGLRQRHSSPGTPPHPLVLSVSAHTVPECEHATRCAADLILFGPVFEKRLPGHAPPLPGTGLGRLREAVLAGHPTPVLALGGVTPDNAAACAAAGAAGLAGIRLFTGAPLPLP